MKTILVAGVGKWGENYVRVLKGKSEVHCVVYDTNLDRAIEIANKYSVDYIPPKVPSIMPNLSDVDAVIIATPTVFHYTWAAEALHAGKDVLIEKPITMCHLDAVSLAALSRQNDCIAMSGHLMIYHLAIKYIKKLVSRGLLGKILYIYTQRLNLGVIRTEESCWQSLAPHDISMMLYLVDSQVSSVNVNGGRFIGMKHDVAFGTVTFKNGVIGHIHVSWLDPNKTRKLVIVGTEKMLIFDDTLPVDKVKIYDKSAELTELTSPSQTIQVRNGSVTTPYIEPMEPLEAEVTHFLHCISSRILPTTSLAEGIEVVRVLEQGENCLKNNQ